MVDGRVGKDAQVGPPPHGVDKRLARVPADAALLGNGEIARAFIVAIVEIFGRLDADFGCCLPHRVKNWPMQALFLNTHLAVDAVKIVFGTVVMLRFAE